MKVELNKEDVIPLSHIAQGDCFVFNNGSTYMRIRNPFHHNSQEERVDVVNLTSGEATSFKADSPVVPVKITAVETK